MIRLENVSKKYAVGGKDFYALRGVDLCVGEGEMVAVCGRSGSGKSTLLHIIGLLENSDSGSYYLAGKEVSHLSAASAAKLRNGSIGFVMQDFSLINHRTAIYNVKAPMLFNKTPFFEMNKKALEALKKLGIEDQAYKKVENMSGGQRQRVALARALVNDAPLILADEPTGNLDSATASDIMRLFCKLHESGKTIVIVTHDSAIAAKCDRVITISDGKII